MDIDKQTIEIIEQALPEPTRARIKAAADRIVAAKERGGKVAVVTGSGPNLHEGVTTLIAALMRTGIVDGVSTSSAVIAHELGGTLDKVKRCPGKPLGVCADWLPRGDEFELTVMPDAAIDAIAEHMELDWDLVARLKAADGKTIIKAAGNLGYPMGLWLEHLSAEIAEIARKHNASFEEIAGLGCDSRTMVGAGARLGLPVIVAIPQLIGGGDVGLNIGDSIPIRERARRLAHLLDSADVIVESAVALTQEVHDGPFELYTGHGMWSAWRGHYTYSLAGKTLIRMDLDPALEQAYAAEQGEGAVQRAIADGLPKTKLFKVPFRMEMSGFARHEGSLPIIGDIGAIWPVLASKVADRLGVELDFMSYPQSSPPGQAMREWIVDNVYPIDRAAMLAGVADRYQTAKS